VNSAVGLGTGSYGTWNSKQTVHTFLGLAHDAGTENDFGGNGHGWYVTDQEVAFDADPYAERNPSSCFVLQPCGQIQDHYHLACACTGSHDHTQKPCSWSVDQNFVSHLFHCTVGISSEMSWDLSAGCLDEKVSLGCPLIWSHGQLSQNFLPFLRFDYMNTFLDKIDYNSCSVCRIY
jgi:hypothetical protein